IAEAIKFALGSAATDPRDKVYGVLGLVHFGSAFHILKPDYTLSSCQVYHQVLEIIRYEPPVFGSNPLLWKEKKEKDHNQKRCDGQKCGCLNKV
ncbi:hypothetical protein CC86DRAFT_253717, partial [Ophiobolus disseminans]